MKLRNAYTSVAGSAVLATVLATSLALADAATTAEAPANPELIELLSGVDYVPPENDLLAVATEQEIIDIAVDSTGDTGRRIRAYRALGHFRSPETKTLLINEMVAHAKDSTGIETLYCRAAMSALADVATENDADAVLAIAARLDHDNRDVRVAAAQSLAKIGSQTALPPLYQRLEVENVTQVQLAISDAIRRLLGVTSE